MTNKIETTVGQENLDPANMSRARFWTWANERLGNQQSKISVADVKPPQKPVTDMKPLVIDRLRPAE